MKPWSIAHRPKTLDEVHTSVAAQLTRYLGSDKQLRKDVLGAITAPDSYTAPRFMLTGAPGTGKTTTALTIARTLVPKDDYRARVRFVNASDCRNRDDIVNAFHSGAAVVIMDEADNLTAAAQGMLKAQLNAPENAAVVVVLTLNRRENVHQDLQSHFIAVFCTAMSAAEQHACLQRVCDARGVTYTADALDAIVEVANGDMRHAITLLECVAKCSAGFEVTRSDVFRHVDVCDVRPRILKWLSQLVAQDVRGALDTLRDVVVRDGVLPQDVWVIISGLCTRHAETTRSAIVSGTGRHPTRPLFVALLDACSALALEMGVNALTYVQLCGLTVCIGRAFASLVKQVK